MRRGDEGVGFEGAGFGCLAAIILVVVTGAALWVIFVWDVNRV
jgi:hypothetical protein